jgi:hypothetical protein
MALAAEGRRLTYPFPVRPQYWPLAVSDAEEEVAVTLLGLQGDPRRGWQSPGGRSRLSFWAGYAGDGPRLWQLS